VADYLLRQIAGIAAKKCINICLRTEPQMVALARFPARWNHLAEKESRQINMLEQILVGEVMQLRRDLL
jgi:hypothetical protein